MKQVPVLILLLAVAVMGWSQQGSQTKPDQQSTTTLKTLNDSASYAIGFSIASFYKQQGVTSLNTSLISKAIMDVLEGKPTTLDDNACNAAVNSFINRIQDEKSKDAIEEGKSFLATNKTKPGVKTTASGLQYEVVTEGTGARPLATDSVTVNYMGTLINGFEFDNSYKRGEPITFPLNRVIAGWTEGLQLMTVGSKYKLYIPYNLAYGSHDQGPIPGGSTLIFEVELLDVKKKK